LQEVFAKNSITIDHLHVSIDAILKTPNDINDGMANVSHLLGYYYITRVD
jgi:hypothetical protein